MRRMNRARAAVAVLLVSVVLLSAAALSGAPGAPVKILFPSAKARVSGVITVQAEVAEASRASYALLVVDTDRPGSTNSFPCSFDLDTRELSDGPHKVTVEVYSESGLVASSKTLTIYVQNRPGGAVVAKRSSPIATAKQPAPTAKAAVAPVKPVAVAAVSPSVARGPQPEPIVVAARPAASVSPALIVFAQAPRTRDFQVIPTVKAGRLHGGFRTLFTRLGGQVEWQAETRTARGLAEHLTVEVVTGSRLARVNGREVDMGAPASQRRGRTLIPLQFFAEAAGAALTVDQHTGIARFCITPKAVAHNVP